MNASKYYLDLVNKVCLSKSQYVHVRLEEKIHENLLLINWTNKLKLRSTIIWITLPHLLWWSLQPRPRPQCSNIGAWAFEFCGVVTCDSLPHIIHTMWCMKEAWEWDCHRVIKFLYKKVAHLLTFDEVNKNNQDLSFYMKETVNSPHRSCRAHITLLQSLRRNNESTIDMNNDMVGSH